MRIFAYSLIVAITLTACSEEVDLYVKGDPMPVVYSLLDPGRTQQFVRVGRTFFLDREVTLAPPDSDSMVWNQLYDVYIEAWAGGERLDRFDFVPYDPMVKDTGFFPQDNLRIFASTFQPKTGYTYRLYVYFPEMNRMISAETIMHGDPEILDPMDLTMRAITFSNTESYTIRWNPGESSSVYQFVFKIHYKDSLGSGIELKNADYSSHGYYEPNTSSMREYHMSGRSFFTTMRQSIPEIEGVSRKVISVEFIMLSGGPDLGFHFRSQQNSGDVFSNLGDYSNIRNGLGIFSSIRTKHIRNLQLSRVTLDELAHGDETRKLGFINDR